MRGSGVSERSEMGRGLRAQMPRSRQADWTPPPRRRDPVEVIRGQEATRIASLLPVRHERMAVSPFTYFRGSALPMASDLASVPHSGLTVQLCGDAHLSNFGGFASPERDMLFDINDFDETAPGPFEWDIKRLAASLEIAARSRSFDEREAHKIVKSGVRSYQEAIRSFATMSNLAVWYTRLDVVKAIQDWGGAVGPKIVQRVQRNVSKAQGKDQIKARARLTQQVGDDLRFISDPPLLIPVDELYGEAESKAVRDTIHDAIRGYRRTLTAGRRHLLETYRFADLARKVENLNVRSPVDGIVGDLAVQQKTNVAPNQALMTVVDLSQLEVQVQIPETYADALGLNMEAQITYAGNTYTGKLTAISPEVQNNQVTGRVRFAAQPKGLKQNQQVQVRIVMDSRDNVLMVQRGPFLDSGGGHVAYVVRDGVATRTPIDVGATSIGQVEITSGLKEGDTIIISDTSTFDSANTVLIK